MKSEVDKKAQSKRIAKNTLFLYFRMIFLMLVTLYTSRVILDALGVEDYGIYNVVGGFVSMFALISAALTSACSRFLNYEMGKGNLDRQNVVFSTAVTIQWGLAIVIAVLAELVGVWYVNNVMVLPNDRLFAANWCFQFSVFNFCMNLITVPYKASIVAHEKMKEFAYVSIFQGLANLLVSFLIYYDPFDRLIFYAFMLLLIQFSVRMMYQIYCRNHFEECRFHRVFDKPLFMHMMNYSLWHLVGNGASVLKGHGVNLVLNLFFGPSVNAARGVASQVDAAVGQFAGNFMMAMNPQITQSYAKGDLKYMFTLIEKGSRFSFYLLLVLALPIVINADFILNLWLKQTPEYSVVFVRLSLLAMLITTLSRTLITAQNATGNVRNYQLVVGGVQLFNLPLSYLALSMGMSPASVVIVAIVIEIIALFARVYMIPQTIKEFQPLLFFKHVIFPCFSLFMVASSLPYVIHCYFQQDSIMGFLMQVFICFIYTVLLVWYMGCTSGERAMLISKMLMLKKKALKR